MSSISRLGRCSSGRRLIPSIANVIASERTSCPRGSLTVSVTVENSHVHYLSSIPPARRISPRFGGPKGRRETSRYRAVFERPSYLTRLRRTGWVGGGGFEPLLYKPE